MIIFFGSRYAGKTDHVPGLFYVTTKFGHLYWIPLIPVQSMLIIDRPGDMRGVEIPMSGKSILFGWGRVAAVIAAIGCGIAAFAEAMEMISGSVRADVAHLATMIGATVAAIAIYSVTVLYNRPSTQRAIELGRHLGLEPEHIEAALAPNKGESDANSSV